MNKKRIYIISSTLILIGLFAGIVQYVGMFDALYAAAVNPGHSWSQMECSTALCIDTTNNRVGVGTMTPQTTFDVNGAIKIGESTTCNTGSRGAIRYSGGEISICNGSSWMQVAIAPVLGENFTDPRDGNVYGTVVLGGKTWMRESLRYLPSVATKSTASYTTPYYYVLGYDGGVVSVAKTSQAYQIFGALYNWPAAQTACPSGWHLPSDSEWASLEVYLGMSPSEAASSGASFRGTNEGSKLKSTTYWASPNTGINSVYFNVMPGGWLMGGMWETTYVTGCFWTSTIQTTNYHWSRRFANSVGGIMKYQYPDTTGLSVRCVKD